MTLTKADMLEWLAPRLTRGRVLPHVHFGVAEWRADRRCILLKILQAPFAAQPRSCAAVRVRVVRVKASAG